MPEMGEHRTFDVIGLIGIALFARSTRHGYARDDLAILAAQS
jgi:hypothetical protein